MKPTTLALLLALLIASFAVLSRTGLAGPDPNCAPTTGSYHFIRSDNVNLGCADFTTTGTVNYFVPEAPQGGPEDKWVQDPDGHYRRPVNPPQGVSVCFKDGQPIEYEYKYLGEMTSEGHLEPN